MEMEFYIQEVGENFFKISMLTDSGSRVKNLTQDRFSLPISSPIKCFSQSLFRISFQNVLTKNTEYFCLGISKDSPKNEHT